MLRSCCFCAGDGPWSWYYLVWMCRSVPKCLEMPPRWPNTSWHTATSGSTSAPCVARHSNDRITCKLLTPATIPLHTCHTKSQNLHNLFSTYITYFHRSTRFIWNTFSVIGCQKFTSSLSYLHYIWSSKSVYLCNYF